MNQSKEYCIWGDVIKCYRSFEDDWRFGKWSIKGGQENGYYPVWRLKIDLGQFNNNL